MKSMIIPSAGKASRLYPLTQSAPKVLVKLNGIPIFHLLYRKAEELKMDNIIVAVSTEFKRQLDEFLKETYANSPIHIHIVEVDDPTAGVLYSIHKATTSEYCYENILIWLSDTLYKADLPLEDKSFVVCQEVPEPYNRWCLAETNEFGIVQKFWDKPQGECPTNKALIGVYYLKTDWFNICSKLVFDIGNKIRGEYQISQTLDKYFDLAEQNIFVINAEEGAWHDTGTLVTLKDASLNFFISREFNNIKVEDGVLIKSSANKTSIRNQYIWFQNVKNKSLIPNIYSYIEEPDKGELRMEHCNLNDLGTIFNFCQAEKVFFTQTINYILQKMDKEFYSDRVLSNGNPNFDMFYKKTCERLDKLPFEPDFDVMTLLDELQSLANSSPFYARIHGDLILSNILFDPQKMMFKLVDPRGEYGDLGIYGDIRYDFAKLLHSVDGKYESIINNLYDIVDDKVIYYMSSEKQDCFSAVEIEIAKYAISKGIEFRDLKVLEVALFLSMIPLHSDDKKRQRAFFLIAKRIFNELYE